jgi:hypothetical protein
MLLPSLVVRVKNLNLTQTLQTEEKNRVLFVVKNKVANV